ncbi:MAG: hypothetical protein HY652_12245 [Acidobacteria bacterium]|nr:hypothetical protein [Acidobacteriota bacterium]
MLQYNLTVERQLPFNMVSTVAYAGSRGLNIIQTKEGNPTVPEILPDGRQFWTGRESRTNPNWDTMELKTAAGNSWYNSLQWGLVKRLSHGLQFQSSYTWSKIIDETQGQLGSDDTADQNTGTDPTNRKVDKGPAGFDIRHNWRFNAIYRLPGVSRSGAPGTLLNGWWVSGILSTNTGYPFTPNLTTNRSRSRVAGAQADRPDLVAGRHNDNITRGVTSGCLGVPAGRKLGGPELYFDPCAFAIQPAGFLGTAGRNILRAPGFASFDFSLAKDTPLKFLGESGKLEFRGEFFNILNRPNFSAPQRSVYAGRQDVESPLSAAGIITQTAGTSRQIQFGLKLLF